MTGKHAVVVGGGLAGLAAALRLAESGTSVTVLESRPRLGGATTSFQRGALTVDTGQHVFLRCYTEYIDFLRRVGSADLAPVQSRFEVPVLHADGRQTTLRRNALPAPLHLAGALGRYGLLTRAQRVSAVRAALRLRMMDPDDERLDAMSFGDWLAEHGQDKATIEALWGMFTVAALNTDVDTASLALAVKVFRTGLLTRRDSADIGVPEVPLSQLHGDAAAARLAALGAEVRTGTRVREIARVGNGFGTSDGSGVDGAFEVVTDDERLSADLVVLAVPHHDAARLLPPEAFAGGEAAISALSGLGSAAIVNVHVHYDRPVIDQPFVAVVGSPVQWLFDRTAISGARDGQYLAVSLSAAADHIDTPATVLREEFLAELARLFPRAKEASVNEFFVTRERRATFRQAPGTRALRPSARTRVPGLLLAGAWTATGWPDTMEGAVRSGNRAARLGAVHLMRGPLDGKVTA
jgi:squalene-associated FAD-dependent desaturase